MFASRSSISCEKEFLVCGNKNSIHKFPSPSAQQDFVEADRRCGGDFSFSSITAVTREAPSSFVRVVKHSRKLISFLLCWWFVRLMHVVDEERRETFLWSNPRNETRKMKSKHQRHTFKRWTIGMIRIVASHAMPIRHHHNHCLERAGSVIW